MAGVTSYDTLLTAIAAWAVRDDLATVSPILVANTEAKVNRWLRDRNMQARDTAPISTEFCVVPTDFAEVISISLMDGTTLTKLESSSPQVAEQYAQDLSQLPTGRPRFFAVLGGQFRFEPIPDKAYTAILTYYMQLPPLSVANQTNWLLLSAPDIYLDGCMAGFYEWDKDWTTANRYLEKFQAGLDELKHAKRTLPGNLRMDPGMLRPRLYNIATDQF